MTLTILVADDDLGTRISVSDYLESLGYSVIVAKDGKQALSMIDKYKPHALITDINMPRMDGYELVRQVRQKPAFRLFPVVFLSERNSVEERIRGHQAGCDAYLPKPFEIKELVEVIRNLLNKQIEMQRKFLNFPTEELPKPPGEIEPGVINPLDNVAQDAIAPKSLDFNLTEREKDVLRKFLNFTTQEDPKPVAEPEPTSSQLIDDAPKSLNFSLTKREKEVLDLLTTGLSNIKIGTKLHLSHKTIEKYVSSLIRKTQTNNRTELVRFALENHLVEIKARKTQE